MYLMEDITPLRKRLLNYVKTKCDDQFVMCHTMNGKIHIRHFAAKAGKLLGVKKMKELVIGSLYCHLNICLKYNINDDFDALRLSTIIL